MFAVVLSGPTTCTPPPPPPHLRQSVWHAIFACFLWNEFSSTPNSRSPRPGTRHHYFSRKRAISVGLGEQISYTFPFKYSLQLHFPLCCLSHLRGGGRRGVGIKIQTKTYIYSIYDENLLCGCFPVIDGVQRSDDGLYECQVSNITTTTIALIKYTTSLVQYACKESPFFSSWR